MYRLDHSVDKAKERGIILRNGLDCLNELTQSLEDLGVIIDRGMYNFETWIIGMKQPKAGISAEYEEEFHIRYKSTAPKVPSEFARPEDATAFREPLPEYKDEEKSYQRF